MRLSLHDLEQMDAAYLRGLDAEALRAVSEWLLQDLKELHKRLNQTLRNSSVPPSSWPAYLGLHDEAAAPVEEAGPAEATAASADQTAVSEEALPTRQDPVAVDRSRPENGGTAGAATSLARRPGKPLGAPGYGRTQSIPPNVIHYHRAAHCAACGAVLPADAPLVLRLGFYTLDLAQGPAEQPGLQVICTLHYLPHRYLPLLDTCLALAGGV